MAAPARRLHHQQQSSWVLFAVAGYLVLALTAAALPGANAQQANFLSAPSASECRVHIEAALKQVNQETGTLSEEASQGDEVESISNEGIAESADETSAGQEGTSQESNEDEGSLEDATQEGASTEDTGEDASIEDGASAEQGDASVEEGASAEQGEGDASVEEGASVEQSEGDASVEEGASAEQSEGDASLEQSEGDASAEEGESAEQSEGDASIEEGASAEQGEGDASVEQSEGDASVEDGASVEKSEGDASVEEGASVEQSEGDASVEEGASVEQSEGDTSIEQTGDEESGEDGESAEQGEESGEDNASAEQADGDASESVEQTADDASAEDGSSAEQAEGDTSVDDGEESGSLEQVKQDASTEQGGSASVEETEEQAASTEEQDGETTEQSVEDATAEGGSVEDAASTETDEQRESGDASASVEDAASVEATAGESVEGDASAEQTEGESADTTAESVEGDSVEKEVSSDGESVEATASEVEESAEAASVEGDSVEAEASEDAASLEEAAEQEGGVTEESQERASRQRREVGDEEVSSEEVTEVATDSEASNTTEPETVAEELSPEIIIPSDLRSKSHVSKILRLDADSVEPELLLAKTVDSTLRELKRLYDTAIKPLEILYKYRDLSNRHFGDPEIFSKPLILFMGPWSGGKSTIINYLMDIEYTNTALRTGAEPSPAYFNILMHGDREEVLDGTQLAADWTFSGLQKFGQGLLDRLRGLKLNNRLLEKVNIVEIPGILEIRKQVERVFPFNDACQWFIDRADVIFLVYDPSKLDVGPETEAILDQLKGREYQTRIVLNKADQVRPEELMRVQGTLIWNISPLMSSSEPPVMYSTSLWAVPYEPGAPTRLLYAQEEAFLKDIRDAINKRVENKIASARRFAVRVRNHAKMVDCYLTTYYNHKTLFGNKQKISDDIIEHPQNYHIYEGLSTLTNISRYDLPDPEVYRDFFKLNPLYEFQQLAATCTYFRGCPINRLDVAIAYDLPELVGKYKKAVEEHLATVTMKS